jgi:signal transduction histidine kinase
VSISSFLEEHPWQFTLGFIAILLTHGGLGFWLLRERRRRMSSEVTAHELSRKLINSQEEERARLARELHDDITQRLAVLALEAGRAERASSSGVGDVLRTIREGLSRLSRDVHALSYSLHPSVLEELGLCEALKVECEQLEHTSRLRVALTTCDLPVKLPKDVALCLFRVVQESARNVVRHASATQVEIHLQHLDGGLEIRVIDDGDGFLRDQLPNKASLGHASMEQRVAVLGGRLKIESQPYQGTSVSAWVPLASSYKEKRERELSDAVARREHRDSQDIHT